MPREFDDYIAKPKANNYRSLHTAVIGPEGKPLEVQIRTREMHQHSEYGVAAHWRYKEGARKGVRHDPTFDEKIAWLRQVLDWKDAVADSSEWLAAFKESLFTDTIYVLTPQGKVIDLPRGATPVDFAYAVHTDLGHRCRGAKVDGQMVPLNYALANGQRVEIIAASRAGRRATGSTRTSATSRATARARRCGSGSRRSSTTRPSRRAARWSSASSRALGQTALKLDARRGEGRLRQDRGFLRRVRARRHQPASRCRRRSRRSRSRRRRRRRPTRSRKSQTRREPRRGLRQRHPRRRRRPAADRARALLQARAARSDRRLRHARQGRHDPSRDVRQRRAHARARSPSA